SSVCGCRMAASTAEICSGHESRLGRVRVHVCRIADITSSVPMYRIELAPGEKALFKSIDEMAAGIANGVIKSTARIWHQTSAKWLPIEFHPHYKIALTKGPHTSPRAEYREPPSVAGPAALATPPIFEQSAPRSIFEAPAPA